MNLRTERYKRMNEKKIFSKKLAIYLRNKGCKIIGTEANTYKPEFDVWIFKDNEHLQECLAQYMSQ